MDIGEVKAASFDKYFSVDEELSAIIGGNPACSYLRSSCAKLIGKAKFRLLDIWERSVFPKNRLKSFVSPDLLERLDHVLVKYTPLRLISTNVEFVAQKDISK